MTFEEWYKQEERATPKENYVLKKCWEAAQKECSTRCNELILTATNTDATAWEVTEQIKKEFMSP